MRRRDLLLFVSGGTLALLSKTRAQGSRKLIGLISGFADEDLRPLALEFRSQMRNLGWSDGDNIAIDVRASGGNYKQLERDAQELVAANAAIIVAMGTPGLSAVLKYSHTVPVVFTLVADPVEQGLIESLSHPGGSATGLTNFEFSFAGKWLEILQQMYPSLSGVTLIADPANANTKRFIDTLVSAGHTLNIRVESALVRNATDIEQAIKQAGQKSRSGLVILPDSLPVVNRELIIEDAQRYQLPAIYPFRIFPVSGGLVSYGLDYRDIYRQAANYTDKILRGTKPSDLPVQAPNKFELVINLKAAKALGIAAPQALQVLADEVIE
ncbi:MAG TPA: ABC transporter substrate-binding protein [Xanthobacteraceae bacterium]|nr:ABC transporter substrate-binding protein [Xanthobacteraceae bacterium]